MTVFLQSCVRVLGVLGLLLVVAGCAAQHATSPPGVNPSAATGTPAHGSETPTAATPCTQAYQVSGTITRVVFSNGMLGTATTVGTAWATGPKGQYRDLLGGDFMIHFLKETQVFEQRENQCQPVALTTLQVGQDI